MANETDSPADKTAQVDENIKNGIVTNGLGEALLGFDAFGWGKQLSQTTTVFDNLRYYLVSNDRNLLSQAYVENGIIKTVVDTPVSDAFRGGIDVKSKELSPEEIETLQAKMEEERDLNQVAQEKKWDRLYGGAGLITITGQDPSTPLDINSIKQGDPLMFRAVDMWELFSDRQYSGDGGGSQYDETNVEYFRYYDKNLHTSRVCITTGMAAPSFIRPRLRGWGVSVVETLIRSINQFLKATDVTFEVLDQFKIDIYKIKNLANTLLSSGGEEKIQRRIRIANQQKSFQNAIAMDVEDDYIQKELTFAGLAETMLGIRMQVASDLRMPMSKIFGISASGFSSGEDDIENYNAMVEATVREDVKHMLNQMVKLRCQSLFGYVPEDLQISFKPLRILSSEQEENVKNAKFTRLLQARQSGEISSKEFKDGCNKENLLSIQVDASEDSLVEELPRGAPKPGSDDKEPEPGEDTPGEEEATDKPKALKKPKASSSTTAKEAPR